jgi:hypothetical protein
MMVKRQSWGGAMRGHHVDPITVTGSGNRDNKKDEDSPPQNNSLSDCHGLIRAHRLVDLEVCSHDPNII